MGLAAILIDKIFLGRNVKRNIENSSFSYFHLSITQLFLSIQLFIPEDDPEQLVEKFKWDIFRVGKQTRIFYLYNIFDSNSGSAGIIL